MSNFQPNNDSTTISNLIGKMDKLTIEELALSCCSPNDACNCTIPFCCQITLPEGFKFKKEDAEATISFTKCCLKQVKGICQIPVSGTICNLGDVEGTISKLVTKVFGCIHYIIAVDNIKGDCGAQFSYNSDAGEWDSTTTDKKTSACCSGSVCVDKIVSYDDVPLDFVCPCPIDELAEVKCKNIVVEDLNIVQKNCDNNGSCNKVIKFTGNFKLTDFDHCQ